MKIALCLFGQPRGFPTSYHYMMDNLIIPNNIEDIFIHSWYSSELIGTPFDSAQPAQSHKLGVWNDKTEEIFKKLNPKKIICDPPKDFSEYSELENRESAIQTRLVSNFYSKYISCDLKSQYEKENNFVYDLVVITRTDIQYHNKIIINEINTDPNSIYVAYMHHYMRENDSYPTNYSKWNYSSLGDTFAIGNSKNINIFSSIYLDFKNIHADIWPYVYGEAYQGYVVRGKYNIPIIGTPKIAYNLYRGN